MVKRIRRLQKIVFILFSLLLIFLILIQTNWFWRFIYPLKYEKIILENSKAFNLDPYLIASIIYVESKYIPQARSHKGALGLMQIMPNTGSWIAEQLGMKDFSEEDLFNPEKNILFGSWYLSSLNKEFNNELVIVLAAYNAGRGNINKWLNDNKSDQSKFIVDFPFAETRNYINKILIVCKKYKEIYDIITD